MSDRTTDIIDQLGHRIALYRPLPPSRRQVRWTIGLIVLLSLAAVGSTWQGMGQPWILLLFIGLLSSLGIREWRARRFREIELFQRGIVWSLGRRRLVTYWNEIREVYRTRRRTGRERQLAWSCRIVRNDGREWRLEQIEDLGVLGVRVETAVTHQLLPSAVQAFRDGFPVRFGRQLTFRRNGVEVNSKLFAWYGVREIALEEGLGLRIVGATNKTEVVHLTAAQVPNLGMLAAFLEAIRAQAASSEPSHREMESTSTSDSGLLTGPDGIPSQGNDPSELLLAGFEWDDIQRVLQGEVSLEELLARGPRHRPRHPR